jgi:hypothetical protein
MAFTYSKLAEVTVGSGGAATIVFNNIPQNYNDLIVKISGRSASGGAVGTDGITLEINGSTSNFSSRQIYGDGATTGSSSRTTNYTGANLVTGSGTASTFNNTEIYFPNYTSSFNKSFSIDNALENNATLSELDMTANLWSNATAIISLTFKTISGSNYVQHSTATLYGVKAEV